MKTQHIYFAHITECLILRSKWQTVNHTVHIYITPQNTGPHIYTSTVSK